MLVVYQQQTWAPFRALRKVQLQQLLLRSGASLGLRIHFVVNAM